MKRTIGIRAMGVVAILGGLALLLSGCGEDNSSDGAAGATGTAGTTPLTETVLGISEELPGVVITVTSVTGGSRADGTFQAGDTIKVNFTVKKNDGTNLPLSEIDAAYILASGPTFNYQRIMARKSDVKTLSVQNGDGSYSYSFATAIPSTYLAPQNDTTAFTDGELTGQALLAGTYTVGMYAYKNYTVEGTTYKDVGNATKDFLFGGATAIEAREAVLVNNCNRCHVTLQAHSGTRRDVKLCVLCHTAGAEDSSDPLVTPGVTIEFKVMIHRIHNGKHLPSVLGVATNADGSRNYAATATPYAIDHDGELQDYSEVGFPVMPSAEFVPLFNADGVTYKTPGGNGPMPRDTGYSALTVGQKLLEDKMRSGVVACAKCHGDPDGSGSLTVPSQGNLAYAQPTRRACGSCHDDVDWTKSYVSNGQTMAAQTNDASCVTCHASSGNALAVQDAHTHPYSDPTFNTGVNVVVSAVGGGTGTGGKHQAGDPVLVTFNVTNDAGSNVNINALSRFQWICTGPTSNIQQIIPAINLFDVAEPTGTQFRKSTPFTGNGSIGSSTVSASAPQQTLAIVFTAANVFSVSGSVSGALAAGIAVPDGGGNTGDLTYAGVTFKITDGSTNFAAGDRYYLEVYPTAASYAVYIPRDITRELLGTATGGANVLTVGNLPLYWGRQVVYERTALSAGTVTTSASAAYGRYVTLDSTTLTATGIGGGSIAINDIVVLDNGLATEEYIQVGRIQTTDDVSGADLGTQDRLWFATEMRYAHANGASVSEVTLTSKREGTAYTVTDAANGKITLVAGQFTNGNRVVANYRTYARFGWYRAPGDALQSVYPANSYDSDDFDITWGDWKGKSIVAGTYTVGLWASIDFAVTPLKAAATAVKWDNIATDNTPYQMMSPSATKSFLYGNAALIEERALISSGGNCNVCHDDLAGHGMRRRGFDACVLCHGVSGVEDKAKYATNGWYVGATPNVTTDFRVMLHRIHMGKNLTNKATYNVIGDIRGTPFNANYADVGFSAMPGEAAHCATCHGSTNTAWKEPAARDHPTEQGGNPVRIWKVACTSCHDSSTATAHADTQTSVGIEACGACHGTSGSYRVEWMHKNR